MWSCINSIVFRNFTALSWNSFLCYSPMRRRFMTNCRIHAPSAMGRQSPASRYHGLCNIAHTHHISQPSHPSSSSLLPGDLQSESCLTQIAPSLMMQSFTLLWYSVILALYSIVMCYFSIINHWECRVDIVIMFLWLYWHHWGWRKLGETCLWFISSKVFMHYMFTSIVSARIESLAKGGGMMLSISLPNSHCSGCSIWA